MTLDVLPSSKEASADVLIEVGDTSVPASDVNTDRKVEDLQKQNVSLKRSLQAKSKIIHEGVCFNSSVVYTKHRREKAELLGAIKKLKDAGKIQDNTIKMNGLKIDALDKEIKKLSKQVRKLEGSADGKDRKIATLRGVIMELKGERVVEDSAEE